MFHRVRTIFVAVAFAGCGGTSPGSSLDDADSGASGDDSGAAYVSPADGGNGGSSSPGTDAGSTQTGDAAAVVNASGGAPYDGPAGQFVYGPPSGTTGLPGLLASVHLVTVTWEADTEDISTEIATAFGPPGVGGTAWWAGVGGYCVPGAPTCVGTLVTATAAHVGDPPGLPFVDSAIAQSAKDSFPRFINDKSQPGTGGKPPDLPAPVTASTLYVFFLPRSLVATSSAPALPEGYPVTVDGAPSCGYHSATTVGVAGTDVAYAVVPRCQVAGQTDADVAIATAFREIADAVTDPFRAEGRLGFHNGSASATAFEIGDFCPGATGTAQGIAGFSVPEIWSNQSMACVP